MDAHSYDEFSLFHENLNEWGLDVAIPPVRRFFVVVDGLRQISGLQWGEGEPELAFIHGSAQNAHTFDTVALALGRPLLAFDLPSHGHSDPSPFKKPYAAAFAADLERAMEQLLPHALPLVGMSLGGMTSIIIADERPDLVSKLVLVDITPGINAERSKHIFDFVDGPKSFDDFDKLLERTVEHNPTRSVSSLRRGILHNALQRPDGTWVWRHQQHEPPELDALPIGDLWERLGSLKMPVTLLRGMAKGTVVDDEDEDEFRRRLPDARIFHVEGAGHSIQGDQPLEMAALIEQTCF